MRCIVVRALRFQTFNECNNLALLLIGQIPNLILNGFFPDFADILFDPIALIARLPKHNKQGAFSMSDKL